jgi:hypothetical protein
MVPLVNWISQRAALQTLFFAVPIVLWVLPPTFSVLPLTIVSLSPVAFPAISFTDPLAVLAAPFKRSLSTSFYFVRKQIGHRRLMGSPRLAPLSAH